MTHYLGLFFISCALLAQQIALGRIFSIVSFYHLSFVVISLAMLGVGVGGVSVYLFRLIANPRNLSRWALGYAASVVGSLAVVCSSTFIGFDTDRILLSLVGPTVSLLAISASFFCGGIIIALCLTRTSRPIGRVYAVDLIGAAAGCLFALGVLSFTDPVTSLILCAVLGGFASVCFGFEAGSRVRTLFSGGSLMILVWFAAWNSVSPSALRPLVAKGQVELPGRYAVDRSNSFSRVTVSHPTSAGSILYADPPKLAKPESIESRFVLIDGLAGTFMPRFSTIHDVRGLNVDLTNAVYQVRPKGGACVIGVGGGRDMLSALAAGHEKVVGIEINPLITDLLTGTFRSYSPIADQPGAEIIVGEARQVLTDRSDLFETIQMSMIDTWASTSAGGFSLSENGLYTVEAWVLFLSRLTSTGVFSVSRWHNTAVLGESGRAVSLAVAALFQLGVQDPDRHIAVISSDRLSTILVSKQPWTSFELDALRDWADHLGFTPSFLPGSDLNEDLFFDLVSARTASDLIHRASKYSYDLRPTTDESPYFFQMLRLREALQVAAGGFKDIPEGGTIRGNVMATAFLVALLCVLLCATIIISALPWFFSQSREAMLYDGFSAGRLLGLLYCTAIGLGFMLFEVGIVQRLSVFLTHPTYALGIVLCSVILSTGVGSLVSECVRTEMFKRWQGFVILGLPPILLMITGFCSSSLLAIFSTAPLATRIAVTLSLTAPIGFLLGFFFPIGLRVFGRITPASMPWFWGVNGAAGVLASVGAVFISVFAGISWTFFCAAGCYLVAGVVLGITCKGSHSC